MIDIALYSAHNTISFQAQLMENQAWLEFHLMFMLENMGMGYLLGMTSESHMVPDLLFLELYEAAIFLSATV